MAKIEDFPGKGLKKCPHCKKYIGFRSAKCPNCSHDFVVEQAPKTDAPQADLFKPSPAAVAVTAVRTEPETQSVGLRSGSGTIVYAPAGEVPIKLESTDEESIMNWRTKIVDYYAARGVVLPKSAIRYLATVHAMPRPYTRENWDNILAILA